MNAVGRSLLSMAILGVGIGCYLWMGPAEIPKRPPNRTGPTLVRTTSAVEHQEGIEFEVDGVVVPFREIEIAAQVGGRIEFKSPVCDVGRAVKTGDLLVRIEQRDYLIEVSRLEEELKQADAMLGELDAEIETATNQIETAFQQLKIDKRQVDRSNDLRDRRVTSEVEVDDALRAELNSRNAWQTLIDQKNLLATRRIRLESAKALGLANLEKAKLALSRTEIRSPIDGIVVLESVEQDGYIQTGNVVLRLQDTSQLDVTCKLHMRQMEWLWQARSGATSPPSDAAQAYQFPEAKAEVIYQVGGRNYTWRGIINRFDGAGVDNLTRMVPCRVLVNDPLDVTTESELAANYPAANPPTLLTGMFVRVRINAMPPIPLVRLPAESIQPGNQVWTVQNGKLRKKPVSIATSLDGTVVAFQQVNGLQAGDQVVVSPLANPIDGLSVQDVRDANGAGKAAASKTEADSNGSTRLVPERGAQS